MQNARDLKKKIHNVYKKSAHCFGILLETMEHFTHEIDFG